MSATFDPAPAPATIRPSGRPADHRPARPSPPSTPGAARGGRCPVQEDAMNKLMPSLRIAVADDERDTREFFQEALPRLGHQVTSVAENGRQLVENCRKATPDLIITD